MRHGLQNAVVASKTFRQTLLAGVRRAIRILATTEFSTEDGLIEARRNATEIIGLTRTFLTIHYLSIPG